MVKVLEIDENIFEFFHDQRILLEIVLLVIVFGCRKKIKLSYVGQKRPIFIFFQFFFELLGFHQLVFIVT